MVKPCQLYEYNANEVKFSEGEITSYSVDFMNLVTDDTVSWLNIHNISDKTEISQLIENLHLDKFLIDEIQNNFSRAKLEEFDDYLYFKIKSILPKKHNKKLTEDKLSFILGKNYLISFQEHESGHFPIVRNYIENKIGRIRQKGSDYLLYKLLDAIVENYFETLESIVSEVERLDELIMMKKINSRNIKEYLRLIEVQKRLLIQLRKIVYPLKDVGFQMRTVKTELLQKENRVYFSKVNESCMMILEEIDVSKQILDGLTNLCYSINDQNMNEIMKVLTLVSTIFIPLTFISGLYGMNFKYMPELEWRYGYWAVLTLMVVIVSSMFYYYKKKGWFDK